MDRRQWIADHFDGSAAEAAVLRCLIDNEPLCSISVGFITSYTKFSASTVRRAIASLEWRGLLLVSRETNGSGANTYQLQHPLSP